MLTRFVVLCSWLLMIPALPAAAQNLADVMAKLNDIDKKVTGIGDQVARNQERINRLETDVSDLKNRVDDLTTTVNEFTERQRSVLLATSSGDVINLRGQMQNPAFRESLDSAVHDVLRGKTGTFTITNKMPTYQRILVNRVEYVLRPGEQLPLKFTAGTIHTELQGEGAKTWMLGPPNYDEGIDIVPAQPTTVNYYGAPANAPVYQTAAPPDQQIQVQYQPAAAPVAPVMQSTYSAPYVQQPLVAIPPIANRTAVPLTTSNVIALP